MQSRVIMLVDLDYFFAQAEETRNPSIRDKPVVVCVYSGRSEDSGAVGTANYVARKFEVRSGMPIALAKRRLQDVEAVFLPVDHAFYDEVSRNVMNILRSFADSFEQVGVDEAFLDVTRRVKADFEEARTLGKVIKQEVKTRQKLTCSVGIGPNKLVAKMAADVEKPDGLTVIRPDCVQSFLFPLPANHLIGVGVKTGKKMQVLGINTIGDVAKYDTQKLIEVFGKNLGVYFHNASLGIDNERVEERGEAESISRISTMKEDTRDLNTILDRVNQLCNEIHTDLLQRELSFKNVGIVAVMTDLSIRSRSKTLESPTNALAILKETAKELFGKLLAEHDIKERRVGVKVSGFVKEEKSQKRLTSFIEQAKN